MTEISSIVKSQIKAMREAGENICIYEGEVNEILISPLGFKVNPNEYIVLSEHELGVLYKNFDLFGYSAVIYWAMNKLNTMPSILFLQSIDWNRISNPRRLKPNPIDERTRDHSISNFKKGIGFISEYSTFSGWKERNTKRLDRQKYKLDHNHRLLAAVMDGFLQIPVFNIEDEYMPNWAKSRAEVIVKKENGKWVFVKNSIDAIIDLENLDELLLQRPSR